MADLSDGVNWNETDALNNNAPPNGWPEGMMPSGVNDTARSDKGALKRFWDRVNPVQSITPSGGVWTFTTSNIAYPTAYVGGEVYSFRPGASSAGGDQFQVNGIGSKPILKCIAPGTAGWVPIIAQDILQGNAAQLVYDASLNAGAGAFILVNPYVPVFGDGAGGLSVPGSVTVAGGLAVNGGDLLLGRTDQAYGYITRPNTAGFNNLAFGSASAPLSDVIVNTSTMEVTGTLSATGYASRSGLGGPSQPNFFNIQSTGGGAHLWIDSTDQGPIVTAPGGNLVIGGNISASGIFQTTSAGPSSGGVSIYATAGAIRSDVAGTALYLPNGNVVCQGITAAGNLGGNVGIHATYALQSDVSGTACYLPNGDLVCRGMNASATIATSGNVLPNVANGLYCGSSGNYWWQVWTGGGGYQTGSDPSLKRDIEPVPSGCLELVKAIEPKTYKWIDAPEGEKDKTNWGFLAPEVADVMARAGRRFGAVQTNEDGINFLAYNDMIAVLWAAVRELADQLEDR